MAQYLITSTFSPADGKKENADDLLARSDAVARELKAQCPNIKPGDSYVLMDRHDSIDFIEADDPADAERAVEIIRQYGKVQATLSPLRTWKQFKTSRRNKTAA